MSKILIEYNEQQKTYHVTPVGVEFHKEHVPCLFKSPYTGDEWCVYEPHPEEGRRSVRTYKSKAEALLDAVQIYGELHE